MDTFEILSTIRNYAKLKNESDIPTMLLRRYANMGMHYVAQVLYPIYHELLVTTVEEASVSAASIDFPGEALRLISVERKDSGDVWRPAGKIEVEDRSHIDADPNAKSAASEPLYCLEGREIYIYPAPSSSDVRIRYRRRVVDLTMGKATYASATTATLAGNSSPDNDVYNSYDVAIYEITGGNTFTLQGIYKCSDYVGSTKVITLEGSGIFDNTKEYHYAIIPIVPEEYHNLIVDAGMIELKKARAIEGEGGSDLSALDNRLAAILKTNGLVE